MVGDAPATGEYRMEFGSLYLIDGVPLVIVALGLFAVPEIVDLLRGQSSIAAGTHSLGKGWRQGLRDTWACRWLVLRCSGLGTLIGAMPGLGGSVVDWIAYGHVVQTSKDRGEFGKGDIRGVIAPESANNASAGGDISTFGNCFSGNEFASTAPLDLEALAVRPPANDLVTTLFTALEFTKLLERFGGGVETPAAAVLHDRLVGGSVRHRHGKGAPPPLTSAAPWAVPGRIGRRNSRRHTSAAARRNRPAFEQSGS